MKYNYKIQSYYDAALNDIEGKDICDICGSRVDKDKLIVKYPHKNSIALRALISMKICITCDRDRKIKEVLGE